MSLNNITEMIAKIFQNLQNTSTDFRCVRNPKWDKHKENHTEAHSSITGGWGER